MSPSMSRFLARLGVLPRDSRRLFVLRNRPYIVATLLVECAVGFKSVDFVIDSGCSTTTMNLADASKLGMPTSGTRTVKSKVGTTGKRQVAFVQGTFRFRLSADQRAAPFVAPIDFEENRAKDAPNLFGLKGVIDQLSWDIGPCRPARKRILRQCVLRDERAARERFPS
jgi:hypothetical protein